MVIDAKVRRETSQQATKVLMQVGHDVVNFSCSTLSAAVPADGMLTDFLLLSSTFKTIQALVPGRRFLKTAPDSNTKTLATSLQLFTLN